MNHTLEVPYYSQYIQVKNEKWKPRSCSIVCLKMAIDFLIPQNSVSADDLFYESEQIEQSLLGKELISKKVLENGKSHDVIVFLAHNHGIPAHKEEFKTLDINFKDIMTEYGINKLASSINQNMPVIVSILPGLSRGHSFHTILLIGVKKEGNGIAGFYYHDPDSQENILFNQYVDIKKFKDYWRSLAIFFN
jgi:hypothetical protein